MSSRFPKSQAGCPHGQLLRQKAQRFKFIVEAVQLPAENFFIVLLFCSSIAILFTHRSITAGLRLPLWMR